jgi:hypothetical protein
MNLTGCVSIMAKSVPFHLNYPDIENTPSLKSVPTQASERYIEDQRIWSSKISKKMPEVFGVFGVFSLQC